MILTIIIVVIIITSRILQPSQCRSLSQLFLSWKHSATPSLAQSQHSLPVNVSLYHHCQFLPRVFVHALPSSRGAFSTGPSPKYWVLKKGWKYLLPLLCSVAFHLTLHLSKWMKAVLLSRYKDCVLVPVMLYWPYSLSNSWRHLSELLNWVLKIHLWHLQGKIRKWTTMLNAGFRGSPRGALEKSEQVVPSHSRILWFSIEKKWSRRKRAILIGNFKKTKESHLEGSTKYGQVAILRAKALPVILNAVTSESRVSYSWWWVRGLETTLHEEGGRNERYLARKKEQGRAGRFFKHTEAWPMEEAFEFFWLKPRGRSCRWSSKNLEGLGSEISTQCGKRQVVGVRDWSLDLKSSLSPGSVP